MVYTDKLILSMEKIPKCTGGTIMDRKHFPVAVRTTLTSLLQQPFNITCCDRFDKTCQYRLHRTSNTHRAELIENCLMVDSIKAFSEVNLHNPSLLLTFKCALQCTGHTQQCITRPQTFPISELGGWKHAPAFHKSSNTNWHQMLKHLWQHWCYGSQSVIGNRTGRYTFRN